jgi:hypothetical protein
MKFVILTIVWSVTAAGSSAFASNDKENQRMGNILNTANNWYELVREYWPKSQLGDVDGMVVSYNALNNCYTYKDAVLAAESIDDIKRLLAGRTESDILFAQGLYFRCKELVNHFDEFPDWQGLRIRAAMGGDHSSMVSAAIDYYRLRNELHREEFPYSPGEFLMQLMVAGYPPVFDLIGEYGRHYGILNDPSDEVQIAWFLLACKFRDVCDKPESIKQYCAYMMPECMNAENLYDVYRQMARDPLVYGAAEAIAHDLYSKILEKRFDELGVNFIW